MNRENILHKFLLNIPIFGFIYIIFINSINCLNYPNLFFKKSYMIFENSPAYIVFLMALFQVISIFVLIILFFY